MKVLHLGDCHLWKTSHLFFLLFCVSCRVHA